MSPRNDVLLPLAELRESEGANLGEFSPDGRFILTADGVGRCARPDETSSAAVARLWDAASGAPASPRIEHLDNVNVICFSPDSRQFLTAGNDGRLCIHSTATGELQWERPLRSPVTTAGWTLDGQSLIVATLNKSLSVFKVNAGIELMCTVKLKRMPTSLLFAPGGQQCALIAGINVFLVQSRSLHVKAALTHRLRVTAVAWRNRNRLLTASDDYIVREWNSKNTKLLREVLRTPRWIWTLQCTADGNRLLIGTEDQMPEKGNSGSGHGEIVSLRSGKRMGAALQHQGTVFAAFSPDENMVVTGSSDMTVSLWDAETCKQLGTTPHGSMVFGVRFSPKGDRILAVGGQPKIWKICAAQKRAGKSG